MKSFNYYYYYYYYYYYILLNMGYCGRVAMGNGTMREIAPINKKFISKKFPTAKDESHQMILFITHPII